jgi:crossover junction endodeoxyribonuclease RusA
MTLELPWPPTTNHAYTVARGRKIKTAKARAYAAEVIDCVRQELDGRPTPALADARLGVTVDLHEPDRRRRDIENHTKLALDAVAARLGFDDSQIDVLTLRRKTIDRTNPRIVLTVEVIA